MNLLICTTNMKQECIECKYITNSQKDWKKHLNTKKHVNHLFKEQNLLQCPVCISSFGSRTSLWRHKKTCSGKVIEQDVHFKILEAIKENTRVNKELLEKRGYIIEHQNVVTNNIVNINMFLNSECANAMSIQNFIRGMTVTIEDLCNNKRDALTNIVIRNLQPLSITERPVHYKDKSEWYIKDESRGWNEDNGKGLLEAAAFGIQRNWQKEFEIKYPGWMEKDNLRELYVELAGTSSSDIPDSEKETILRTISEKVMLCAKI